MDDVALNPNAATLVNTLTCEPADQDKLLDLLRENTDNVISTLEGWISTTLVAGVDGSRVVIVSQWRDAEAVKAMQSDERMRAYFPRIAALARFDSTVGTVACARSA